MFSASSELSMARYSERTNTMTNGLSDSNRPSLFTTHKALAVMEKLLADQNQSDAQTTYEPCCGSGSFLMTAAQQVAALSAGSDYSTERTIDLLLTNPPFSNS